MPLRTEARTVGVHELGRALRLRPNGVEANPPGRMAVVALRDARAEEHRVRRTVTPRLVEGDACGVYTSRGIRYRVGGCSAALGLLIGTCRRGERDAHRDKQQRNTKT